MSQMHLSQSSQDMTSFLNTKLSELLFHLMFKVESKVESALWHQTVNILAQAIVAQLEEQGMVS